MHKTIDVQIRGISPLMLHNGQLANPLNEYARQLKSISGKRKKTDADYQAMADIEWEGGLYLDENDRVVFPGDNLEAAMIEGGKKQRLGDAFKAGLLCDGLWILDYEGPKTLEKLKKDERFRDFRKVSIKQASIMRTRPVFVPWGLKFTLQYLPDLLNPEQVLETLQIVGRIIGIGDFTPKYGRFELVA